MIEAARAAARLMIRDFGESEHLRYSVKGNQDYVTQTDLRAEEVLCKKLSQARPQFDIIAEERGFVKALEHDKRNRQWVIDPLDGTNNFIHGFPFFAISIAAIEDGEVFAGIIYTPLNDEMFSAEKDQGAFLNNYRIRVSSQTALNKSLMAYSRLGNFREKFISLLRSGAHTRQLGSIALSLAYTASARLDGFITGEAELWDIAAGIIIIREAGGVVSCSDGSEIKIPKKFDTVKNNEKISLSAANSILHQKLTK